MRLCDVIGCGRKHYAFGKCVKHYQNERSGKGQARRRYGERKPGFAISVVVDETEAVDIIKAASIMNMTRSAFIRAVLVGEARLVLRRPNGADRRGAGGAALAEALWGGFTGNVGGNEE